MAKPEIQLVAEAFRAKARRAQRVCKLLRGFGVGLSIAALFATTVPAVDILPERLLEWLLVVLSLLCQVVAEYFHSSARRTHFNARDGYRWFLLCSSIADNQTKANVPLDDLKQKAINIEPVGQGDADGGDYFYSKTAMGWKRLLENLYESLYFTKAIMEAQHTRKSRALILAIAMIVAVLIAILTLHTSEDAINPYLVSLALISLVAPFLIELLNLSRGRFAVEELSRLQERMKAFLKRTEVELATDVSIIMDMAVKYYCVTVEQEPVSESIYLEYNAKLSKNYADHILQLNA